MRRLYLVVSCASLIAALPVAVALAAAPAASTAPASAVSSTTATLNASVDPNGRATSVHFQWGRSTSYGNTSATVDVGSGSTAVPVSRSIAGLTTGVTYHYRVVATNADGTVNGADRTFTTGAAPGVSTGTPTNVGTTTATLRASVDPNGLPTTYRFQYGTSASNLSRSSATVGAGSGVTPVSVAANIGALSPNVRIYYRVVAANSAGTRNGATRSFVTGKSLVIDELSFPRSRFGGSVVVTGDLDGTGVAGTTVTLQGTPFPFTAPLANLGSARANGAGRFAIRVGNIQANLRVRLVAAGNVSATHLMYNGNRVGVRLRKGRRLTFSGTITPQAPNGRVRIQKRKSNGRWGNVRRGTTTPFTNGRSRYSLRTRASKGLYRVQVVPRDGGAHSAGYSRRVRVR